MSFDNLNSKSIAIFVIIIGIIVYLILKRYTYMKINYKKIKNIFHNFKFNFYKNIILLGSFITLLLTIFQPKGFPSKQEIQNKGVDIMFVLDVSKSMNTLDINTSTYPITRLKLAKQAIKQYIIKHPNNKYGLVIFAGNAITTIPLTLDTNTFLTLLEGVDYKNLTQQGTNFNSAIQHAINSLKIYKNKGKVLVLISDGGDPGDYNGLNIDIPKNLKSIVIGIGSKRGGKIYLGKDVFGDIIWQTYNNQYVITKLNEVNLKKLARNLHGVYFHLQNASDIGKLNSYLQDITKQSYKTTIIKKQDLTRYFLMASFILFIIYLFIEIKNEKSIYN